MSNNYLCPKCHGHLKVGDSIVFSTKSTEGETGLILLSPELGNYKVKTHPSFSFSIGDHIEFFCPLCNVQLTSEKNEKLAKILMIDDELNESEILFSKIVGEKCTYKIIPGHIKQFGKDSTRYLSLLNKYL